MLGSVLSVNSLCVVEPGCPPEFVIVLKPCDVKEGEKAEFSCQVTGNPPPEVTWLFDGQPLQGKGQYALLTKNKLQVGGDQCLTDGVCARVSYTRHSLPVWTCSGFVYNNAVVYFNSLTIVLSL